MLVKCKNLYLKYYSEYLMHQAKKMLSDEDKRILSKNKIFLNAYQGKRCFILGNGPSLKKQDLSTLKNEYVFTANLVSKFQGIEKAKSNFHFVSDPIFFEGDQEERDRFLNDIKKMETFNSEVKYFCLLQKKTLFEEKISPDKSYFFSQGAEIYDGYQKNCDYTSIIPNFTTVVDAMIMFAVYAGFQEIYLLGCDCTGILPWIQSKSEDVQMQSYAYETDGKDKKMLARMSNRWRAEEMFKHEANLFKEYRILKDYCAARNVSLVNCTAGGILDELPIKKLEDVLNEKAKTPSKI